ATFMVTPMAPPESSVENRAATFKLTATGSLTGDIQEAYTGYRAADLRQFLAPQSAAQREQWLRDRMSRMFAGGEVEESKIENVDDPNKPLMVKYHLEAPQFAQVTGKRILFQPNAFRRSQVSPFSASERRYPVQFPFAWKEIEDIRIELPAGYELEN